MACYRAIPYAANNFKIITMCNCLHTEFASTYYNDKEDAFIYIFGQYIKPNMKEIDHPALIKELKLNLVTSAHLKNVDKIERLPSQKKDIYRLDIQ